MRKDTGVYINLATAAKGCLFDQHKIIFVSELNITDLFWPTY